MRQGKGTWWLWLAGVGLGVVAIAQGSELPEVIGYVRSVGEPANFTSRGQTNTARVGQGVLRGALLQTGPGGSLGLVLNDGTRLSLGPRSELHLDRYRFEPARGALAFEASLSRGSLSLVSGDIARLKPGAVRLHTPQGEMVLAGEAHLLVRLP
ncbi:FecR domain-containing protein [Stutzerimonas tarimensis]|uniref:FecR domain-containing protein n=1 Tax=Stutzerimonas tarimensis TaxID=1507735 RepID=A0ABV7T366_9GAMM